MGDFRELLVWRRATAFADRIHGEVTAWDSFELWTTGVQLVRAIDSVGANIAEGFGRCTTADQRRFLVIARGSVCEAEHWIGRAHSRNLLTDVEIERELREVGRMLNGLLKTLRTG